MECVNCEQLRRDFVCPPCLSRDLRTHRTALFHLSSERDLLVAKASASLEPLQASRRRRAEVAATRARLDDVQVQARKLREGNEEIREQLTSMRAALVARRTTLDEASRLAVDSPPRTPTPTPPGGPPRRPPTPPPPRTQDHPAKLIVNITSAHTSLQDELAKARRGLVHELVDVFAVVEVGGRPAVGVRAGTPGDWAIGGLVLPVPGDMRRFPPVHVNAALTFTVHFVGLLSFYLGVKMPFEVAWTGGRIGVGIPEICAGRGGEGGAWARWAAGCPLHLPLHSSSGNNSPPSSPLPSPGQLTLPRPYPSPLSSGTRRESLSSSSITQTAASFPTALAMLSYNTAYLAYTQGVEIPLSIAASGAILPTLWAICCSAELGYRSHATGTAGSALAKPGLLPPPTHGFALDFRQLLQAQATPADHNPVSPRMRVLRGREGIVIEEEEGWEVIEEE